ncbi:hypothetical protein GCM10009000_108390 [Halobacterium noricense]
MAAEISDRVREIAEARDLPESEVFERALERGLEDDEPAGGVFERGEQQVALLPSPDVTTP